jgi:hypothetical protein
LKWTGEEEDGGNRRFNAWFDVADGMFDLPYVSRAVFIGCFCIGRKAFFLNINFIYFDDSPTFRNDHTKMTAPHPVRSAKLSIFGLS